MGTGVAELTAIGQQQTQRWTEPLPDNQAVRLGRRPRNLDGWAVPWDFLVSRDHCDLRFQNGVLEVRCLETAKNPIYYQDRAEAYIKLSAGEEFRIGNTRFRLEAEVDDDPKSEVKPATRLEDSSVESRSYTIDELRQIEFGDSSNRMELLMQLPALISSTQSDAELATQLAGMVAAAVPRATAVAVMVCDPHENDSRMRLVRTVKRESLNEFLPSRRLVREAVTTNRSIAHMWGDADDSNAGKYTFIPELEWAFCTPVVAEEHQSWAMYVTGRVNPDAGEGLHTVDELGGDIRFTEMLAQFITAVRQVRRLRDQQSTMAQFFSPNVMESLTTSEATDRLAPRECDLTSLYCDLRGFSQQSEQAEHDHDLRGLMDRVSSALGIMTRSILTFDGIVADFQGDAALGFWGWPENLKDGPLQACRAAIRIAEEFRKATESGGALADFRMGVGITHGRGIAGRLRGKEHAHVGAYGPSVELGDRLESLTKRLRAPIVLDHAAAAFARSHLPPEEGRLRRLGRVRMDGIEEAVAITQLLPPLDFDATVSNDDITQFELAVDAFEQGDWMRALEHLDRTSPSDSTTEYLRHYISSHGFEPSPQWDGTIDYRGMR